MSSLQKDLTVIYMFAGDLQGMLGEACSIFIQKMISAITKIS